MTRMHQWLAVAAMAVVVGTAAQAPARAEVIVLGAEGVSVAGEVAVVAVQPGGEVRVELLVSLVDDAPEERELHVVIPLAQPVIGEMVGESMPVEQFRRRYVDELTDSFYDVLAERKRRGASMLAAAVGGGFFSGPVGALVMLQQDRRGVGRVRAYERLGAMPSHGVRFRSMRVRWGPDLRVEDIAAIPLLAQLQPAELDALKRHEGQPYILVRARTRRDWRDLQGETALRSEGLRLGFTQKMDGGSGGGSQYDFPLNTPGDEAGGSYPRSVFVTAPESVPLTVSFPARPRTQSLADYEAQMAYADESASWASQGRQVHMARYDQETPAGAVEIRLREGERPYLPSMRQAQLWRVRAAWILLPLSGGVTWFLAFLGIGRRSASVQELGFRRAAWRSWWVAHALILGPALFLSWTVMSVFDWRLRYLLAEQQVRWAHIVYGSSLLVPVALTVWSLVVLSRFRTRSEGRFLLRASVTALGAGVVYVYGARALVGWLMG